MAIEIVQTMNFNTIIRLLSIFHCSLQIYKNHKIHKNCKTFLYEPIFFFFCAYIEFGQAVSFFDETAKTKLLLFDFSLKLRWFSDSIMIINFVEFLETDVSYKQ